MLFLSLLSLYIINKYNIDERLKIYPRLIKIIKYYEKSSLVYISIEIGMALIFNLIIIFNMWNFIACIFFFISFETVSDPL